MIRLGIICPSEIAVRRFLPALKLCEQFRFAGVAVADSSEFEGATEEILSKEREKARAIQSEYGGRIFNGYQSLTESPDIDAIYLPLPPALHFRWAERALRAGKHALVEKPFTTRLEDTLTLIALAGERHLALHENYMFTAHRQMEQVLQILDSGKLGQVRLYRIDFGFPLRVGSDFRYNKALGGGALLECAGYTMRCASYLLGETARVICGIRNYTEGFDVDMYGSATMRNSEGVTAQLAWGMDNNYRCCIEIWGSKGTLHTDRVFTAPAGFIPHATIKLGNEEPYTIELDADDTFRKSIEHFDLCIKDDSARKSNYQQIRRLACLMDQFDRMTDDN